MVNSKRGFTLIELLVVIAIIALLLAILMPSLQKAKETGKRIVCANGLKHVGIAMRAFSNSNSDKLVPDNKGERHGYVVYRVSSSGGVGTYRWAYLYEDGYVSDPKIFYCNSNKSPKRQFRSYTHPGAWGTLPQDVNTTNQWVRIGYDYFPVKRGSYINSASRSPGGDSVEKAKKYSNLNPYLPYASDICSGRDGMSHQSNKGSDKNSRARNYTLNSLFPDTSVLSFRNQDIFRDELFKDFEKSENDSHSVKGYARFYFRVFQAIGEGTLKPIR